MCAAKSPISTVQEIAVMKRLPLPDYQITAQGIGFQCIGRLAHLSTSSVAESKRRAKHLCAEQILFLLNLEDTGNHSNLTVINVQPKLPNSILQVGNAFVKTQELNFNAVGKLNEYCAQSGMAPPKYADAGVQQQKFIIECMVQNHITRGQASTKKQAKQMAAKEMLSRVSLNGFSPALNGYAKSKEIRTKPKVAVSPGYFDHDRSKSSSPELQKKPKVAVSPGYFDHDRSKSSSPELRKKPKVAVSPGYFGHDRSKSSSPEVQKKPNPLDPEHFEQRNSKPAYSEGKRKLISEQLLTSIEKQPRKLSTNPFLDASEDLFPPEGEEQQEVHQEKIIEIFKQLSTKAKKQNVETDLFSQASRNFFPNVQEIEKQQLCMNNELVEEKELDSEEKLRKELQKLNIGFRITEMQRKPLLLVLKTFPTKIHPQYTFMHSADTYKLTVIGLLAKAVRDIKLMQK